MAEKKAHKTESEHKPTRQHHKPEVATVANWPGAFGIYHDSRKAILSVIKTLILIYVVELIIQVVIHSIVGPHSSAPVQVLGQLINLAVTGLIGSAYVLTVLAGARGKTIEVGDALRIGSDFIVKYVLLSILVSLSLVVSFILFVVPFFFVLPRLALAPYFLIDQKLGVIEAYKASWNTTRGHSAKVWGIIGVSILMSLPVITIIGILLTVYWLVLYAAALALLYMHLTKGGTHKTVAKAKAA
jgi:hypothetical protein